MSSSMNISIFVEDVYDHLPRFSNDTYVATVDQMAGTGTKIVHVDATGKNITYTIQGMFCVICTRIF